MKKSIILFTFLSVLTRGAIVYSYGTDGPGGHIGLTEKALMLKKKIHAGEDLDTQLTPDTRKKIIDCAVAEDEDGPWYNPNYLRHFYNPETGK